MVGRARSGEGLRTIDESSETEEGHCKSGDWCLGWMLVLWRERGVVGGEGSRSCQIDVSSLTGYNHIRAVLLRFDFPTTIDNQVAFGAQC